MHRQHRKKMEETSVVRAGRLGALVSFILLCLLQGVCCQMHLTSIEWEYRNIPNYIRALEDSIHQYKEYMVMDKLRMTWAEATDPNDGLQQGSSTYSLPQVTQYQPQTAYCHEHMRYAYELFQSYEHEVDHVLLDLSLAHRENVNHLRNMTAIMKNLTRLQSAIKRHLSRCQVKLNGGHTLRLLDEHYVKSPSNHKKNLRLFFTLLEILNGISYAKEKMCRVCF